MFGRIGVPELIIVLVIALVIFGPAKLPEIGKAVGKSLKEFKKETGNIMGDGDTSDKKVSKENKEADIQEVKDEHPEKEGSHEDSEGVHKK